VNEIDSIQQEHNIVRVGTLDGVRGNHLSTRHANKHNSAGWQVSLSKTTKQMIQNTVYLPCNSLQL